MGSVEDVCAPDGARRLTKRLGSRLRRAVRGLLAVLLLTVPAGAQDSRLPTSAPAPSQMPAAATLPATPGLPAPLPGVVPPTSPVEPAAEPVRAANPIAGPASAPATLPHNLSPWGMFMQADVVVKAVMVGLAFASLVTWTVWLAKGLELVGAKRKARSASRKLERADSLREATRAIDASWTRSGPVADLVHAAVRERRRSGDFSAEGIKERLSIALSRIEARAGRGMTRGTGLLATIGATAPFVGLFGTVWGIMNSFIGISQSKTTNLAVVAPGIAEALLATAIGLVAAIPAVIIYNVFARSIAGYRALLSDASGEVLRHLSRDLERQEREAAAYDPSASARAGPPHTAEHDRTERTEHLPRAVTPALRPAE
jgi:biopolymer transport protein ExbB